MSQYFIIVVFFILATNSLIVPLKRQKMYIKANINDIVDIKSLASPQNCDSLNGERNNVQIINQFCYEKDLFFNLEVTDSLNNKAQLAIDVLSPITQIKSKQCRTCYGKPTEFFDIKNCSDECSSNAEFHYKDKQKTSLKLQQKNAILIQNENDLIYGTIKQNKFSLQLEKQDNEVQQLELQNFNYLSVLKQINYQNYPTDGVFGLGIPKTILDSNSQNTFFDIVENQGLKKQFGVFIYEVNEERPNYALTLGEFNKEYALDNQINPIFQTRFQDPWQLQLQYLHIDTDYLSTKIKANTTALISYQTSFIHLPRNMIQDFIQQFVKFDKVSCDIVDHEYKILYCKNVDWRIIRAMHFGFEFSSGDIITIDPTHLIGFCQWTKQKELQNCEFNIRLSPSNHVILGEPFLKSHYTLFDLDNYQVAFSKAAPGIQQNRVKLEFFQHGTNFTFIDKILIVIVVLLLLSLILFRKSFKKLSSKLLRSLSYQKIRSDQKSKSELKDLTSNNVGKSETFSADEEVNDQSRSEKYRRFYNSIEEQSI